MQQESIVSKDSLFLTKMEAYDKHVFFQLQTQCYIQRSILEGSSIINQNNSLACNNTISTTRCLSSAAAATMFPVENINFTACESGAAYIANYFLVCMAWWEIITVSLPLFLLRYFVVPCFLLYLACYLWEIRYVRLCDSSCPLPLPRGEMGFPLVGEMFHLFVLGTKYQRQRRKKYGDIYRTHMFGSPTVIVVGEEHVRRLLLGEGTIVRTQWPSTTRRILGEYGIVNGDKETHHRVKRLALRAFSPKYMGIYAPVVQASVSKHIKEWIHCREVPIPEMCKQMVSQIIMTVLLGIDPNDPDLQLYIKASDDITNSILSLPLDLPGFRFRKGLQARKFVFDKLESKLQSHIEATDEELCDPSNNEFRSVLLNILKLARQEGETKIKLKNLQNLSLEFIFAATQSLQCACSCMIMHLSQRPKIVARLRDEVRQSGLWKTPISDITIDEIESLKFVDCVVKETLRVTPPIPGAVRVATQTFELGGYQIPKGWQVVYSINLTHEAAVGKVLQDGPKCEFEPDAYFNCATCREDSKLKVKTQNRSNRAANVSSEDFRSKEKIDDEQGHVCSKSAGGFSYIPFGKGSRMCAGKNYSLLVLRIFVFELVRNCDLKLKSDCKIIEVPMTKPDESVRVEFAPLCESL